MSATPIGFISLYDAVDHVGRSLFGASWQHACALGEAHNDSDNQYLRVITMIAVGCEADQIAAGYKTIYGRVDKLDPAVWQSPAWQNYFLSGEVVLELPLVHSDGRPVTDGRTAQCPRDILVRKNSLERFLESMSTTAPTARYPGDAALIAEGRSMVAAGMEKRAAARKLAERAEGAGTFESKVDRLRRQL